MAIRIGIGGYFGRMGQTVARLACEGDEFVVVGGIARNLDGRDADEGPDVLISTTAGDLASRIDLFIDFSSVEGMIANIEAMKASGTPYLGGVTGLEKPHREQLRSAADRIPTFYAANFSIGVAVVAELVRLAAAWMPDADVEVVELHHRRKRDAPSGTAFALIEAIEAGRPDLERTRVAGRNGSGLRRPGEIGVHSLRGGGNAGEHQVLFATEGEEVWVSHRALSRETFAAGALRAARWLAGQPPGLYGMKDLLAATEP